MAKNLCEQAENSFAILANSSPIGIYIVQQGKFRFVNQQFQRLTGYGEIELLGRHALDLVRPEDRGMVRENAIRMLKGEHSSPYEYRVKIRGGATRWVEETVASIQYEGKQSTLGNFMDVTERKQTEDALRIEHAFRLAIEEAVLAGIAAVDLGGRQIYVNSAFSEMVGWSKEGLVGAKPPFVYWPPEEIGSLTAQLQETIAGKASPDGTELRFRRRNEERFDVLTLVSPLRDHQGCITGWLASTYDITERKRQERQLLHLSTHDSLTNLPNRRYLEDALRRAVARSRRGTNSALLLFDLDNFKLINYTLGHTLGDEVLTSVACLIRKQLRSEDLLARFGGDEFGVLLEETSVEEACNIAARLCQVIREFPFEFVGSSFYISLSIGVAAIDGQQTAMEALARADAAMYKAKEQNGNCVLLYRPEDGGLTRFHEASRLAVILRDALKEDGFLLCYQPVVRLGDGSIDHYEALVRLRGSEGEMVTASEFIGAAARFGLMTDLTRWVVQQVLYTLTERPCITVSINLSGLDLADETLLEFVERQLRRSKVEPRRLGFEINEAAMLRDLVMAERWLRRLKTLGCRLALDEFGGGFISLAHLRDMPVDQIKIDGTLISALRTDPSQRPIVRALQTLILAQGKEIVAEFVETEAIARIVQEMGIDYGQGYHLGIPKPDLDP